MEKEIKNRQKKSSVSAIQSFLQILLCNLATGAIITLLVFILKKDSYESKLAGLSDGFFCAGVIFLALAAFSFISKNGGFNGISFGVKQLTNRIKNPKNVKNSQTKKENQTYFEYCNEKQKKQKKSVFLFTSVAAGAIYMVFSIITAVLWG